MFSLWVAKNIFTGFVIFEMKVQKIQNDINFKGSQAVDKPQKSRHEFIDTIADNVRNPRDVNDCVAVPRGIFKAYMYLMGGSALMTIANCLPKKLSGVSKTLVGIGAGLSFVSAFYFAKPFALKGLLPTVERNTNSENSK